MHQMQLDEALGPERAQNLGEDVHINGQFQHRGIKAVVGESVGVGARWRGPWDIRGGKGSKLMLVIV